MRSFVLMRPEGTTLPEPEDWRLLPDGFSRWALIFPAPWLLVHGLWLAGIVALAVPALVASFVPGGEETKGLAFLLASFAVALLTAMEGPALAIDRLARRGHAVVGVIEARSRLEAEDKLAVLATRGARMPPPLPSNAMPPPLPGTAQAPAPSRTPWRHPGYRRPVVTDAPSPSRTDLLPLGGR